MQMVQDLQLALHFGVQSFRRSPKNRFLQNKLKYVIICIIYMPNGNIYRLIIILKFTYNIKKQLCKSFNSLVLFTDDIEILIVRGRFICQCLLIKQKS